VTSAAALLALLLAASFLVTPWFLAPATALVLLNLWWQGGAA
jgi:hypothetical protein